MAAGRVFADGVIDAEEHVVPHGEDLRAHSHPLEAHGMAARRHQVHTPGGPLPGAHPVRGEGREGIVPAHGLKVAGVIVVGRLGRRHEGVLLEVDGVVAGLVDRLDRFGQGLAPAGRQADLIGVEMQEPVGVQRASQCFLALQDALEIEGSAPRQALDARHAAAEVALGDGHGGVRGGVVDQIDAHALADQVVQAIGDESLFVVGRQQGEDSHRVASGRSDPAVLKHHRRLATRLDRPHRSRACSGDTCSTLSTPSEPATSRSAQSASGSSHAAQRSRGSTTT